MRQEFQINSNDRAGNFSRIDLNRDGIVTRNEFVAMSQWNFERFDTNNNGVIDSRDM